MRPTILLLLIIIIITGAVFYISKKQTLVKKTFHTSGRENKPKDNQAQKQRLKKFATELKSFAVKKNYSTDVCFLADMQMHSGKKRFFVYDLKKDSILYAGLVAHGSCNSTFLINARFSNVSGGGCSSTGRYAVSYKYNGRFGRAYKLKGLDSTNSKAFDRHVVLHAYSCVPDNEPYPIPICNSLGCPMVSYSFLNKLDQQISHSKKPILLWMFD